MQTTKHYDIAIIGKGITGLSSAYALRGSGHSLAFFDDGAQLSATDASANMICGGFIDNYTRISQRHGADNAKAAWTYSHHAYDALLAFAKEHDIPYKVGQRIRLIETEDERVESEKAIQQLQAAGFASRFETELPRGTKHLLGQQRDEAKAAWIEKSRLINVLRESTKSLPSFGRARSLKRAKSHFVLETETQTIHAEVVILANHLGMRDLIPNLKEVLVSTQDQWMRLETRNDAVLPFPEGTLLTWRHGHYWAQVERRNRLLLGGARFFRPLAGFEAESAELSEKISKHLPEAFAKYFPDISLGQLLDQRPGLDIRPCDEMPVIGPMYGESGLFVATGFMGQGLSLGFKAGQSLARIVLGEADELPRFFWPERHRSLASAE